MGFAKRRAQQQMEKQMKNKKEFYATQFEKLGFEKIPTEDGFTMYELDPSKLKEKIPKKCPGLRIVEHVKWEGKDRP